MTRSVYKIIKQSELGAKTLRGKVIFVRRNLLLLLLFLFVVVVVVVVRREFFHYQGT